MKPIYLLISIMLFLIQSCGDPGKDNIKEIPKNTSGIILFANTALRIDPLVFSTRVAQLKKGQSVQIIDKSRDKRAIGSTVNYWYKIKTDNGYMGWIYGTNIKLLKSTSKESIKSYIDKFWVKESKELQKEISGKWWSIDQFDDFTNHCLEIFKDGSYRSYWKGYEKGATEGKYTFDFEKTEIQFDKGTTFQSNLSFIKMGLTYVLKKDLKDNELRFKKILIDVEKDREDKLKKEKTSTQSNDIKNSKDPKQKK